MRYTSIRHVVRHAKISCDAAYSYGTPGTLSQSDPTGRSKILVGVRLVSQEHRADADGAPPVDLMLMKQKEL